MELETFSSPSVSARAVSIANEMIDCFVSVTGVYLSSSRLLRQAPDNLQAQDATHCNLAAG
jgi:hypothetical protein